ncbi:MAG: enoyl-CoA hydratase/carnithine racemase [Gammaproteobacteria bacterium]|jgi:enoyl-CoA hydratase/carnithine racemase
MKNFIEDNNEPFLQVEKSGRVQWLFLNRPKTRNTLSLGMIDAIKNALEEAYNDNTVGVVVLAAYGPVFSAGHDLHEMQSLQREVLTKCADMMMSIVHGSKPVIACIDGIATAGGCQLVSSCDLAVASEEAQFCTPGVNIGGFCTTPLVGIGRKIQRKHAMEMALTGELFSAQDAARFGLINRVIASNLLIVETEKLAQKIASKSNTAIELGKKAFYQQIDMPIEDAYAFATERMIEAHSTADSAEGIRAFFEKREPKWGGR